MFKEDMCKTLGVNCEPRIQQSCKIPDYKQIKCDESIRQLGGNQWSLKNKWMTYCNGTLSGTKCHANSISWGTQIHKVFT